MVPETQKLIVIVARVVDMKRSEVRISPSWVATEAMIVIDPSKVSPPLAYLGCHLELRQIARQLLRKWFETEETDDEMVQHELFPGLQRRYPISKADSGEEPVYVRLEDMTEADIAYNVARLEREGHAKLAHANALRAFGVERFSE
jgi:hypothetical protein